MRVCSVSSSRGIAWILIIQLKAGGDEIDFNVHEALPRRSASVEKKKHHFWFRAHCLRANFKLSLFGEEYKSLN